MLPSMRISAVLTTLLIVMGLEGHHDDPGNGLSRWAGISTDCIILIFEAEIAAILVGHPSTAVPQGQ